MKITNGGTAFPQRRFDTVAERFTSQGGLTLRDHFAGLAMQGLMDAAIPMSEIAKEAYLMADLMLKAREAETQQEKLLAGYEMARLQAIAEKARRMNGRVE
jgi:hypothetical protein